MYIQLVVYIQTMILYFQNMFHRQSDTVYWQWAQQTETQGNSIKKNQNTIIPKEMKYLHMEFYWTSVIRLL